MSEKKFIKALKCQSPLQIVGTINAYIAMMAESLGFKALYLSGAGVANMSYGIPDIGMTTLEHVLIDAKRITDTVSSPLLVDIDTGWDIGETIKKMVDVGVAAVHIEDQVEAKKCGHLEGKTIISTKEMVKRIESMVRARGDADLCIMARTDAYANEGLEGAIARARSYKEAGADLLFPEAMENLNDYRAIKKAVGLPILANLTEFGKTPLFTINQLQEAGIDMALYPLSAARAMNRAAFNTLKTIKEEGSQKSCLDVMQTRDELYTFLGYTPSGGCKR